MPTPQERRLAQRMLDAIARLQPQGTFSGNTVVFRQGSKKAIVNNRTQIVEREDRAI